MVTGLKCFLSIVDPLDLILILRSGVACLKLTQEGRTLSLSLDNMCSKVAAMMIELVVSLCSSVSKYNKEYKDYSDCEHRLKHKTT